MMQRALCVMHLSYSAAKPKALAHALFISIALYAVHWSSTAQLCTVLSLQHPCLRAAKVDTSVPTPCANCFSLYLQTVDYVVQPHTPRRTFITQLADKGVGVRVLAELAGHSSISVTQRYIDVNDAQLARAVELL